MRKKLAAWMTLLLMLAGCFSVGVAETKLNATGLDIVVVIDQSSELAEADRDFYRFDAAQILLSMIDLERSNVGMVAFHHDVLKYPFLNVMYAMNDTITRANMIKNITDNKGEWYDTARMGQDSNLGAALEQALNMLEECEDSGNMQAILLVSDGVIKMRDPKNTGKPKKQSEEQTQKAMQRAREKGIKIYTMYIATSERTPDTKLLGRLAEQTKAGQTKRIESASELPTYFNEIFASQLGSDLVQMSASDIMSGENGEYYVEIDVPNKSVREMNLVISKEGIENDSVRLVDPQGKERKDDNKTLFAYDTIHHQTFKILQPEPSNGGSRWRVYFKHKQNSNAKQEANEISIQYVFSYNIDTVTQVKKTLLPKHEPIEVQAWFTEKNGLPSSDETLYNSINAAVAFSHVEANGKRSLVLELPMESIDSGSRRLYQASVNAFKELNGQLPAGEYEVGVHFFGSGLNRDGNSIIVELQNKPPELIKELKVMEFSFGDPNGDQPTAAQTVDLAEYVEDPNGDPLVWSIAECPGGVKASLKGSVLTVEQKQKAVSGSLRLQVRDEESEEPLIVNQNINVTDMSDRYSKYKLALSLDGLQPDGDGIVKLAKGQKATVLVMPMRENTPVKEAIIYGLEVTVNQQPLTMRSQDDGSYIGEITADDVVTSYAFEAHAKFGSEESGTEKSAALQAKVENHSPVAMEDFGEALSEGMSSGGTVLTALRRQPKDEEYTFWIKPLLLGGETQSISMDLREEFSDEDGEAETLKYGVRINGQEQPLEDGYVLTLSKDVLSEPGKYTVEFSCTDNDNADAAKSVTFTVASIKKTELRVIGVGFVLLAAAIVVIMIVRYMLKPAYAPGMQLQLYLGGMPQRQNWNIRKKAGRAKKAVPLGVFDDGTIGPNTNNVITTRETKNVILLPARGNRLKVKLNKKLSQGITLNVGGRPLANKNDKATMSQSQRISFSTQTGTDVVSYELQMRQGK